MYFTSSILFNETLCIAEHSCTVLACLIYISTFVVVVGMTQVPGKYMWL